MLLLIILPLIMKQVATYQLNKDNCGVNSVLQKLDPNATRYIVRGEKSTGPGVWPWVCSVGFQNPDGWDHNCGGTLVTYQHVLTAAHCPTRFNQDGKDDVIKVRCGDFHLMDSSDNDGVQVGDVISYDRYPDYKYAGSTSSHYDIAILNLETRFQATNFVRPICLLSPSQTYIKSALVLGWGLDEYGEHGMELKKARVQILDPAYCDSALESVRTVKRFGEDLFCAADPGTESEQGGGTCQGDSGGPTFGFNPEQFRYELLGLVNGGPRCGDFEKPDKYTRTVFMKINNWIRVVIECDIGQECVAKEDCPYVLDKYAVIRNVNTDIERKERLMVKAMYT